MIQTSSLKEMLFRQKKINLQLSYETISTFKDMTT